MTFPRFQIELVGNFIERWSQPAHFIASAVILYGLADGKSLDLMTIFKGRNIEYIGPGLDLHRTLGPTGNHVAPVFCAFQQQAVFAENKPIRIVHRLTFYD